VALGGSLKVAVAPERAQAGPVALAVYEAEDRGARLAVAELLGMRFAPLPAGATRARGGARRGARGNRRNERQRAEREQRERVPSPERPRYFGRRDGRRRPGGR
jgi:hypothetical protein